jgi:hypothetical protein
MGPAVIGGCGWMLSWSGNAPRMRAPIRTDSGGRYGVLWESLGTGSSPHRMKQVALRYALVAGWIMAFAWFCYFAIFFFWIGWATVFVLWSVPGGLLLVWTRSVMRKIDERGTTASYRAFLCRWLLLLGVAVLTQFGSLMLSTQTAARVSETVVVPAFILFIWLLMLLAFAGVTAVTTYSVALLLRPARLVQPNGRRWGRLVHCINGDGKSDANLTEEFPV